MHAVKLIVACKDDASQANLLSVIAIQATQDPIVLNLLPSYSKIACEVCNSMHVLVSSVVLFLF